MRIVSLCPSTTETLIDFGLEESLVGITKFCIHPKGIVDRIEKVGGTKNPKVDRIRDLKPDLVLFNEEENRREDFEALRTSVRVEVAFPRTIGEVPEHLRWLGDIVDRPVVADTRIRELVTKLEDLDAARAARPTAGFRFAYLIWRRPWMAAGTDTYIDDLLSRAGGTNVLGHMPERYPEIQLDALASLQTDVVLLPDEPFPFKTDHIAEVAPKVPSGVVITVSGDDCCWHGVRSIRGAELARQLFARYARP